AGSTVNVGTAQLLSADSEVVLTAATDGAILTATAAVTTSGSEAPANLALSAQPLTLTSGTLTVATGSAFDLAKALTIAAGAELVANGTVNVAITDGSLVLTGAASTGAKISGAGGVKAGATTITGIWQAVETSASATVKIEAASAVASSITASATTVTFTAGTGGTITQGVGTSNNLTIGANTTIDLGASAGSIVLKGITTTANNGKITLAATTATITANSGSTNATLAISGADVGTSITGKKESSSSTKLAVLAGATSNNTIASDSASDFTISGALAIE
ncbi:MAG: hypothetical protein LBB47_05860, partial [Spirochaetaceae bacterium]|nr:hypothetical protein [Spirochaetaceae bacterium]